MISMRGWKVSFMVVVAGGIGGNEFMCDVTMYVFLNLLLKVN